MTKAPTEAVATVEPPVTEVATTVEPRRHAIDVLREQFELSSPRVGCEHGVCGACTIRVDGRIVRGCLLLAVLGLWLRPAASVPPELLDALAADFVAQRYDVRHLIRTICNSSVYSLSSIPNASNGSDQQSFARYYPKRLSAEVLLDAISDVLEAPSRFPNVAGEFPVGTRAIELPDEAVPSQFLDVFGRPARNSACECERVSAPALGQTLALVSSNDLQQKLMTPNGYVDKLASAGPEYRERVRSIFQRVFARPPRDSELQMAVAFLESQSDVKEGYRSLLWALLATNEFLFNH